MHLMVEERATTCFSKTAAGTGFSLAACGVLLCLMATTAQATPFTIDIAGTISGQNGSLAPSSPFSVGDNFSYSVALDDGVAGPTTGGVTRALNNITEFSFSLGSYLASGSSGDVFLRNNGSTGVFGGAPYDQATISHLSEPVYAGGFNLPGRTDFESTSGPVSGENLRSIGFTFQTPSEEFVGAGESLLSIARNIESNPDVRTARSQGGGGGFSVSFSNEAFGSLPLSIDLVIDSFEVNAGLATDPLSFGTATAAIARTTEFGNNATQIYDSAGGSGFDDDSFSLAFITSAGQAAARADITTAGVDNGVLTDSGLLVGAAASAAGSTGQTASRAVAFRTYEYGGDDPLTVNINSLLTGAFDDASFGLPNGTQTATGGVFVFDALDFAAAIDQFGGELDDIFFPLANKGTDNVNPLALNDRGVIDLLGLTPLAQSTFSEFGSGERLVSEELTLLLNLISAQQFTVLYDLATESRVACTVTQCGAGSVNFLNTLQSAPTFFTDQDGLAVTSISPLSEPSTVPEPGTLLLFGLALAGLAVSQRRKPA